jgi:hypothetical protein
VVVAAMVDVRLDDQKRALLISETRWEARRQRHYSPVGGALQVTDAGRGLLNSMFHVEWEGTGEDEHDLRVRVPKGQAEAFIDAVLHLDSEHREQEKGAYREAMEELVDEHRLLSEDQARHALTRLQRQGVYRCAADSNNPTVVGPTATLYVFETYVMWLSETTGQTLLQAAAERTPQPILCVDVRGPAWFKPEGGVQVSNDAWSMFTPT